MGCEQYWRGMAERVKYRGDGYKESTLKDSNNSSIYPFYQELIKIHEIHGIS